MSVANEGTVKAIAQMYNYLNTTRIGYDDVSPASPQEARTFVEAAYEVGYEPIPGQTKVFRMMTEELFIKFKSVHPNKVNHVNGDRQTAPALYAFRENRWLRIELTLPNLYLSKKTDHYFFQPSSIVRLYQSDDLKMIDRGDGLRIIGPVAVGAVFNDELLPFRWENLTDWAFGNSYSYRLNRYSNKKRMKSAIQRMTEIALAATQKLQSFLATARVYHEMMGGVE